MCCCLFKTRNQRRDFFCLKQSNLVLDFWFVFHTETWFLGKLILVSDIIFSVSMKCLNVGSGGMGFEGRN